jgi:sugar/nucleoside kinase (ribokinase family)
MTAHEVLVMGEVLVELSSPLPLDRADAFDLSFSGDALNAAVAAAAAGASVGLLARIGDDELGARIVEFVEDRNIDASLLRRMDAPNGVYFVGADPEGTSEFVYVRRGSAGSELGPDDVDAAAFNDAGAVVLSGITQALSDSCAAAVARAAQLASGRVVYDPNFRQRLTGVGAARRGLADVAPHAAVVTPSCPSDTLPVLGTDDPAEAAVACLRAGAAAAAVTRGAAGVLVDRGDGPIEIPPVPAPSVVDSTGAGDVFAGTVAALLADGEDLVEAARLGAAAAALSLAGQGGTGRLAPLDDVRRHLGATPGIP